MDREVNGKKSSPFAFPPSHSHSGERQELQGEDDLAHRLVPAGEQ